MRPTAAILHPLAGMTDDELRAEITKAEDRITALAAELDYRETEYDKQAMFNGQ